MQQKALRRQMEALVEWCTMPWTDLSPWLCQRVVFRKWCKHTQAYHFDSDHFSFFSCRIYMYIWYQNDQGRGWRSYTSPFEKNIWLSILGWLLVSAVIITAIEIKKPFNDKGFFEPFYSLCTQGTKQLPFPFLIATTQVICPFFLLMPKGEKKTIENESLHTHCSFK